MTARLQNGFLLSAGLHALVVALALLVGYAMRETTRPPTQILELVAGVGDNFGATVAPALGEPGGVKLNMPKPAPPKVEPVTAPPEPAPTPVEQAPTPPKTVEPIKAAPTPSVTKQPIKQSTTAAKAPPTIAQDIRRKLWRAEDRGKKAAEKDRAAEQAAAKAAAAAAAKVKHIDAEGIRNGVVGGSTENTKGGAGGKALTSTGGTEMEMYFAMLKQRFLDAWEKPPGSSDKLVAQVEFRVAADGKISGVRLIKRSGNGDFDRAIVEAFDRIEMPKRPDGKNETFKTEIFASDK